MALSFKFDINQSIKDFGFFKTFILAIVFVAYSYGMYYLGVRNSTEISQSQNVSLESPITSQEATSQLTDGKALNESPGIRSCIGGRFEDQLDDWIIEHYDKPTEEGYYCPRSRRFPTPDIWYVDLIPMSFSSVTLKYELLIDEDSNLDVPTSILSIGEQPRILRIYIPERNPQLVGIETISIEDPGELKRHEPIELKDPIQPDTVLELTVRPLVRKGNEITYTFNIKYVSKLSREAAEDSFSVDVSLHDPHPETGSVRVGLGALLDSCIKPISYEFCD